MCRSREYGFCLSESGKGSTNQRFCPGHSDWDWAEFSAKIVLQTNSVPGPVLQYYASTPFAIIASSLKEGIYFHLFCLWTKGVPLVWNPALSGTPHTKLMPSAPTPTLRGTSPLLTASVELNVWLNPFTPESDQCQISPAASQEIWHHTVWRIWLFIAYSDERWLYYKFSLHHAYNCFLKGWENTLF